MGSPLQEEEQQGWHAWLFQLRMTPSFPQEDAQQQSYSRVLPRKISA